MRYSALLIMTLAMAATGCGSGDDTADGAGSDAVAAPAGEQTSPPDDVSPASSSSDAAADPGATDARADNAAQGDDRADDANDPADDRADDPADGHADDRGNDSGDDDVASIPSRFHGEWNADPAACGTGSNPTRLRISADRIRFYESVGVVQDVDVESERVVTVEAQYQGEGDTWSDERRLSLSADGNSLTVSGGGDLVRQRCP